MAPQGVIYNERYLSIGDETLDRSERLSDGGHQRRSEMLATPTVSIGRRCVIGRGSHIIGHWSIELGDEIQTGPYVYITDQNHSYEELDEPVGWQTPERGRGEDRFGQLARANVVILARHHARSEHHRRGRRGRARVRFPITSSSAVCPRRCCATTTRAKVGWRELREPRILRA